MSSCLPSSPDMACHHMISVTASAGEAKVTAATTAASCRYLNVDFTIKTFRSAAVEAVFLPSRVPIKLSAGGSIRKSGRGAPLTIAASAVWLYLADLYKIALNLFSP